MRLRRVKIGDQIVAQMQSDAGWKRLTGVAEVEKFVSKDDRKGAPHDLLSYLELSVDARAEIASLAAQLPDAAADEGRPLLPVIPRSLRDFVLHEKHVINASRGMVRRLMPGVFPLTWAFERITGLPFPKFKPHKLWYKQPIYYLSNHLNLVTDGDEMPWPKYTELLDYELELAAILARPLRNASTEEAASAIGGFVVLNDFSARDVQIDEMQSGFGPQKAKHFCSAISAEIVTADEVLEKLEHLTGTISCNGKEVASVANKGGRFTLPEAIAFASRSENLIPGEVFASGTWPNGAGIENGALVAPGDQLKLSINGIGELTNIVGKKEV